MKKPPPAYRPAARQPQRPLDRHAIEAFTKIFTEHLERRQADLEDAAESEVQLIRHEINRITDIIEEINSEGIKPSMLNAYISEVHDSESFRRHVRQFAWSFGQGEADPADALNNAKNNAAHGVKMKDGPKGPRLDDLGKELKKTYIELRLSGQIKPTWRDVVNALTENNIIQEVDHDAEEILWRRASTGKEETTSFENIPDRMSSIKEKLKQQENMKK